MPSMPSSPPPSRVLSSNRPQCGVGGYARLAGFDAREGRLVSVDGYLRAPAAAREDMFEIDETRGLKYYETPWTKGLRPKKGHLAAGVRAPLPPFGKSTSDGDTSTGPVS